MLIVVCGFAGSGKTTLCQKLVKEFDCFFVGKTNLVYLSKDTIANDFTDFILAQNNINGREDSFYVNNIKPIEYQATFKIAKSLLAIGSDVIVDIPFVKEIQDYELWQELCSKTELDKIENLKTLFIWCKHDIKKEKQRIIERNYDRDIEKIKKWDRYAKSIEEIKFDSNYNLCEYDSYAQDQNKELEKLYSIIGELE